MKALSVMLALAVGALPRAAAANEEAKPAPAPGVVRTETAPVRAGKTTVTVIDEGDSFESIIERVRGQRMQDTRVRERFPVPSDRKPQPERDVVKTESPPLRTDTPPARTPRRLELREMKKPGDPGRPLSPGRERIRERIREGKPLPSMPDKRIERLRSR